VGGAADEECVADREGSAMAAPKVGDGSPEATHGQVALWRRSRSLMPGLCCWKVDYRCTVLMPSCFQTGRPASIWGRAV
jgi:hypothetical protein